MTVTDMQVWTPVPAGLWTLIYDTIRPYAGCSFVVPGDPVPKGRPRLGKGRTFTPKRTKDAEKKVRNAFRQAMPGWAAEPDLTYGVLVNFQTSSGCTADVDNATKMVMDALNEVFYQDDLQVGDQYLHVERGAAEPMTEVLLFRVPDNGTRKTQLCECGIRYRSAEKSCAQCRNRRAIVNRLLTDDDTGADAANQLDRHRRQVLSYVTASTIGTNTTPSVAAIAAHVGVTPHRAGAVITTLIADGNLAREGRRLKVIKPLGAATR